MPINMPAIMHFLALTIRLPWPIWVYLGMSILTLVLYLADKSRAARGKWRISESTLHLCELAGGWPGAFLAQRLFRHKNRKRDYLVLFYAIVAVHLGFWVWYFGWAR